MWQHGDRTYARTDRCRCCTFLKFAKEFTDTIRHKAMGQKVLNAVSPGQLMVKIVAG